MHVIPLVPHSNSSGTAMAIIVIITITVIRIRTIISGSREVEVGRL
jgi:hypothetical protein